MAFVPLRPEAVQKLLELRKDLSETNQWAGEVTMMIEQEKKDRYLLLTECCLYIFTKSLLRLSFELSDLVSIFDLVEINLDHDELIIKFKNNNYHFIFPESATLMNNLLIQYRSLLYQVNPVMIPGITEISAAYKVEQPLKRPIHLLLHRYIAACISKKADIEKSVIELFKEFDEKPTRVITFKDFELLNPSPVFFAVSMEGSIRSVILDSFSPSNLGNVAVWILTNSNRFFSVTFQNYSFANFKGLTNKRSQHNHMNTINIIKCTSEFVESLLSGLKPSTYSIETLIFESINVSESLHKTFLNALQNYAILSSLISLSFIDCKCTPSFLDLALNIIRTKQAVRTLKMESCDIDICELLIEMSRAQSTIQVISLRHNYGNKLMNPEDALPSSIISIDVGNSEWSPESLTSFFSSICRWTRKMPLALIVDQLEPQDLWNSIFSSLPVESLRPVITELNLSCNKFDSGSFEQLLRFLETQSPLLSNSHTKLMHLSLSNCFNNDVEQCFEQLINFFSVRELWGLELCDIITSTNSDVLSRFISDLTEIQRLTSLNLSGNFINSTSARSLINFVQESLSIAEIGMDRSSIQESDQLIWLYDSLMNSSHILAFNKPIQDLSPISHFNEVKKINSRLLMKRQLSNTHQRLSLFLSLSGDFSTRVPRIFNINNSFDEDIIEGSNTSELLFEQNFMNPIPSLFTLASLTNIDMSVDPLASMVTEYIVTSGKFGIVPPTAPPPEAPKIPFALPVIFATMQFEDEIEPDIEELDFDPNDIDLSEISIKLSEKLKEGLPLLSVSHPTPKWVDRKQMMTIPLIEFTKLNE